MTSLQDQLLQAGLVDSKKAKKAQKEKRKQDKQNHKSKQPAVDDVKQQAKQAMQQKAERDRALNAANQAKQEEKAMLAQIKQIVLTHRQPKCEKGARAELAYRFSDGSTIKTLYVSESVQDNLTRGRLVVVKLEQGYELLPAKIAEKVAARDETFIISQQAQETLDADDPYADYVIPDDLMW